MPSITETMRSVVPESTGKKDLRAEKTSSPAPESKAVEAGTAEAQVDQVELSESVVRAIEDAKFFHDVFNAKFIDKRTNILKYIVNVVNGQT